MTVLIYAWLFSFAYGLHLLIHALAFVVMCFLADSQLNTGKRTCDCSACIDRAILEQHQERERKQMRAEQDEIPNQETTSKWEKTN